MLSLTSIYSVVLRLLISSPIMLHPLLFGWRLNRIVGARVAAKGFCRPLFLLHALICLCLLLNSLADGFNLFWCPRYIYSALLVLRCHVSSPRHGGAQSRVADCQLD